MAANVDVASQTQIVLRTEGLRVYYGDLLALSNIWLDIPKNQVTAFIGPSGCGKSVF